MYLRTVSDLSDHLPCLVMMRSGTPDLAAAVAPPRLKLCEATSFSGQPNRRTILLVIKLTVLRLMGLGNSCSRTSLSTNPENNQPEVRPKRFTYD
mmetsp:Transcript_37524/g.60801  ORF Transcript_37524/g.60801 Transcript_37524/m.60801 type:complete len:95 (-) Transcript_37524:979-1263(-)